MSGRATSDSLFGCRALDEKGDHAPRLAFAGRVHHQAFQGRGEGLHHELLLRFRDTAAGDGSAKVVGVAPMGPLVDGIDDLRTECWILNSIDGIDVAGEWASLHQT